MIPMGRLTKKIQCQDRFLTIRPPSVGPTAIPTETMVPLMPSARHRSDGGNASVIMAIPNAMTMEAPTACTTRKPISV